jgi:quinol monooxygenase YgiN
VAIQVLVVIETKAGQRASVLQAFHNNTPAVRAEPGCLDYRAYTDAAGFTPPIAAFGPDTIVVLEKWERIEDLNAHAKAPHTRAYQTATKDSVEKRTVYLLSET